MIGRPTIILLQPQVFGSKGECLACIFARVFIVCLCKRGTLVAHIKGPPSYFYTPCWQISCLRSQFPPALRPMFRHHVDANIVLFWRFIDVYEGGEYSKYISRALHLFVSQAALDLLKKLITNHLLQAEKSMIEVRGIKKC